jgi:metallo-beta-lactamase class B
MVAPSMAAAPPGAAEWNKPHKPFRIYGNTYYVGTEGLSAVLITSEYGHVLIDGGLPESAPLIAANIQELGFKLGDVKAILNSHTHPDHAGGIAELQRLTGAQVYALRAAEQVLRTGKLSKDDPQASSKSKPMEKLQNVWIVTDDQLLGIGSLRLRVLATPGHTPGGTTWTWDACEGSKCLAFVYADSLSPVSAGKYRFKDHPEVLQSFEASFARLEGVKCELLLAPHPQMSGGLARLEQAGGDADKLKDEGACKAYVKTARENLAKRLAEEQ